MGNRKPRPCIDCMTEGDHKPKNITGFDRCNKHYYRYRKNPAYKPKEKKQSLMPAKKKGHEVVASPELLHKLSGIAAPKSEEMVIKIGNIPAGHRVVIAIESSNGKTIV